MVVKLGVEYMWDMMDGAREVGSYASDVRYIRLKKSRGFEINPFLFSLPHFIYMYAA